jgi:NDP-sugar pyrophosphorylase family protein/aminoglycoside/choline kinase family phosphotransferase
MSINLFIPAAGLGTRLRPLTLLAPKPLLPIAGIPLIQRIIEQAVSQLEIDKIGVNTHYMPETVHDWLDGFHLKESFELFHEEDILGTGGALKNATSLLSKKTFIVANGDVLSDMNWQKLLDAHRSSNNLLTLAVQDREHERRVGVDADLKLKLIDKECATEGIDHWFGYACAAVYEPEFLDYLPDGESHVVPYWVEAAQKTGRVGVYDIGSQTYWLDMGTPQSFVQVSLDILMGEKRFLKKPLSIPWDCKLKESVIIEEDVKIGAGVSLKNAILLPGTEISNESSLENVICGPGFECLVDWPVEVSSKTKTHRKIGQGGSDRVYTRLENEVVLYYSAFEENIDRQIELTKAFLQNGVQVPEVLNHNPLKRTLSLQDLGDTTFQQWSEVEHDCDEMLGKILAQLEKFQLTDDKLCPSIHDKVFNYDVLRWESSYFLERFVKRVCEIDDDFTELEEEFHRLAKEVDALPKKIMHRDFQSENIMIKDEQPYFIDFQGAHWGTPFFDLVSLLRDPYTSYSQDIEARHRDQYLLMLGQTFDMPAEECWRAYTLCGMQRHMQALGAYGFLTHIRGKENFMKHYGAAFNLLFDEVKEYEGEFPKLMDLLQRLEGKF